MGHEFECMIIQYRNRISLRAAHFAKLITAIPAVVVPSTSISPPVSEYIPPAGASRKLNIHTVYDVIAATFPDERANSVIMTEVAARRCGAQLLRYALR